MVLGGPMQHNCKTLRSQERRHHAILLSLHCVRRLGRRGPLTAQALPCWRDS